MIDRSPNLPRSGDSSAETPHADGDDDSLPDSASGTVLDLGLDDIFYTEEFPSPIDRKTTGQIVKNLKFTRYVLVRTVNKRERGSEQTEENTQHAVAELLEVLERGDSNYQLTSRDAHKIIDAGYGREVVWRLESFTGLDHNEIAHKIIDAGYGRVVAKNLNKFTGLDYNEIAHKFFDTGDGHIVIDYLENFTGLEASVACKIIDASEGQKVIRHLESFTGLDHNEIAHKLIDIGDGWSVAYNLEKFISLDTSVAHKLIDGGYSLSVAKNLESFTGLDHNEIVRKIIDVGEGWGIGAILENFTGLDASIAHKLIDDGYGCAVACSLESFTGLDHNEIAHKLIDIGDGESVAYSLDKFTGLDYNEIAHKLIDIGDGRSVAKNLESFTGLDVSIARKLIDDGYGREVARHLESFTGLDADIAHKLIDTGYELQVLQHTHVFSESASEIVLGCIHNIKQSADVAGAVLEHLSDYGMDAAAQSIVLWACTSHYLIAQKVAQLDLEGFIGAEEASKLRGHIVGLRPELRGVKDYNPYADETGDMEHVTSSRPGTKFRKKADRADRRLRLPKTEHDRRLSETVQQAYARLQKDIASQYGEQYAQEMFGMKSDDKTGYIWITYRRLAADYIAVMGEVGLSEALERAAEAFNQVLRVDTKYYDKLFAEWDAKRIGEREFQEVFLGRDGVYAYVARRAQLYARRRRLGMSSSEAGGPLVEFPEYLVYPRGFRDELDDVVKYEYLRSRIQNPDAAHYYDTGFTGTIPEDIMRVLRVSKSDRDSRIRLLSTSSRPRTVLGLKGDKPERDQIVNTIERNVKDENTAEGLYFAEDGRLESYSRPTSPGERLDFRMVQLALHRHYYTRELKNTEPVNLGYEAINLENQREIRIDGSYDEAVKEQLAELFSSSDIGAELLQSATSLKIANPSDPYPSEAVFELSLADGVNVIVKNVVSEKQQGPVDEFEALLLLRELGIDAPKPIARVFTSRQQGFIVMEKINGESGRTVKDFFANNAVSEANQRELMVDALSRMEEIAETVRRDTGIDKPWRLKDFIIEYSEDGYGQCHIASMRPIDFERVKVFDPVNPHSIELGQGLDSLVQES